VPASAILQQRQRRMLDAQRRLGVQPNAQGQGAGGPPNGANGHGVRDQLLPGGMLPPHLAAAPAAPPSEAAIEQLLVRHDGRNGCLSSIGFADSFRLCFPQALGFDRERVMAALQAADNNVEAAANRLLNGI
jgi:hypothetical protein